MKNEINTQNNPSSGNGSFSESRQPAEEPQGYLDAFTKAIRRIWKNKILWVWGILLSVGGGFSSGFNGGGGTSDLGQGFEGFLSSYGWMLAIFAGIGFLLMIVLWLLSAAVRPGVIRAIDRLQNNKKSEVRHRDIWEQGKARFWEVVKLDVVMFLATLGVIIAFVAVIFIGIFGGLALQVRGGIIALGILTFIALLAVLIIAIIIISYIRILGVIYISLGDMKWSETIKRSYYLIISNKKEFAKLILLMILIGIVGGGIGWLILLAGGGLLFGITFFLFSYLKPVGIAFGGLAVLAAIAYLLLLKSIISLWGQDVAVWWVKKMQGVKNPEKQSQTVTEELKIGAAQPIAAPEVAAASSEAEATS